MALKNYKVVDRIETQHDDGFNFGFVNFFMNKGMRQVGVLMDARLPAFLLLRWADCDCKSKKMFFASDKHNGSLELFGTIETPSGKEIGFHINLMRGELTLDKKRVASASELQKKLESLGEPSSKAPVVVRT